MNWVSYDLATDEIGEQALAELNQKFGIAKNNWNARFASSIVTRSELEIFGISMPRFAIRVYLDEKQKYFLNVRRILRIKHYNPKFGKRKPGLAKTLRHEALNELSTDNIIGPIDYLNNQSCIADCFLSPPGELSGFHVIQASLATSHGEAAFDADNYVGSPYMKHIVMAGGGLCAQAACFMAASLLHKNSSMVHGLAEITHYGTNSQFEKLELRISGLTMDAIVHYFEHAGLGANLQRTLIIHGVEEPTTFDNTLRAYIQSDCPVILPVDCARMAGNFRGIYPDGTRLKPATKVCIYSENDVPVPEMNQAEHNQHAILLVGVDKNVSNNQFCFHDPLTKPFMKTSAINLARSGCYNNNFTDVLDRTFIPVTPREVKLPLGNWLSQAKLVQQKTRYSPGLLSIAQELQGIFQIEGVPAFVFDPKDQFKFLRLIKAGDIENHIDKLTRERGGFLSAFPARKRHLVSAVCEQKAGLCQRLSRGEMNYIWVQCTTNSVWVWDAEQILPEDDHSISEDQRRGFLRLIIGHHGANGWKPVFFGPGESSKQADPAAKTSKPKQNFKIKGLRPSLITSISVKGISHALDEWPVDVKKGPPARYAELYAFMQSDMEDILLKHLTQKNKFVCAMEQMASLVDNAEKTLAIAAEIHGKFYKEKKIRLVAMATFIPEISARSARIAKTAIDALRFLVQLARQLQILGHPLRTVEMVGGSLIDGVWPSSEESDIKSSVESENQKLDLRLRTTAFGASVMPGAKAVKRLAARIASVADEIIKSDGTGKNRRKHPLTLAVELEPGPLYVIGDEKRAKLFCEILNKDKIRSRVVGLNIDIAHWDFLAGIKPETLRDPLFFPRIVHAHISDHGRGHFSDGVINSIHDAKDFAPWLKLLADRAAAQNELGTNAPIFSRFVSVELEASKNSSLVRSSYNSLTDYLSCDLIF